ncbi:hypothetical protein GGH13_007270, partial [Coemansia sp. S155-1]
MNSGPVGSVVSLGETDIFTILLGGEVSGVSLGQQWSGEETQDVFEPNVAFCRLVARFLDSIMRRYTIFVWAAQPSCA